MRRGIRSLMVVLVVVSLPIFWLFRPVSGLPAQFALEDCQRVALTDTGTGRKLVGVEDMALLRDGDTLILSATDRLALEWRPDETPEGGIYQVSLTRLAGGNTWAMPLVAPGTIQGGLFPHGVAVSDDGERLAFVNRARDGAVTIIGGRLQSGAFTPRLSRSDPVFCRANDLAFAGGEGMNLLVTLDRGDCGISWNDLKPDSTSGRVVSVNLADFADPVVEESGLAFANGIAGMYVSETRRSRLHHRLDRPVDLPGGPDNLTYDPFGGLIAAVHPNLFRLAAYRYGYHDTAPSRIVRIGLDRQVDVLFDDPAGELFSGASVAVLANGVMAIGSVRDAGVLVCRKPSA